MDKLQILFKLETCISILETTENVYVRNQLHLIANALLKDWNESEAYAQQIREILNVDETMNNLDNLRI